MSRDITKNNCVFCDLSKISGVEYLGDGIATFIPLNPVCNGHRLFVAQEHSDNAGENPDLSARIFAKCASWARENFDEYNIITSSGKNATQSVFHTHIHLVPRAEGDNLCLPWTNQKKEQL